jgi:hypothetical protein
MATTSDPGPQHFEEFADPIDGTRWRVDMSFMSSNWHCIWGDGCEGILEHRAAALNQGCCSVGAHLIDDDEARAIGALGLMLDPQRFQQHEAAAAGGVLADGPQPATRVVDDACIFFNKPGFPGGVGCALHLAAEDEGESPMDWKPSICWQAPLKVDTNPDGTKTLRPWQKTDWGPGEQLAWCCTEPNTSPADGPSAYSGTAPVAESLSAELTGLVGPEVAVEITRRADAAASTRQWRTSGSGP